MLVLKRNITFLILIVLVVSVLIPVFYIIAADYCSTCGAPLVNGSCVNSANHPKPTTAPTAVPTATPTPTPAPYPCTISGCGGTVSWQGAGEHGGYICSNLSNHAALLATPTPTPTSTPTPAPIPCSVMGCTGYLYWIGGEIQAYGLCSKYMTHKTPSPTPTPTSTSTLTNPICPYCGSVMSGPFHAQDPNGGGVVYYKCTNCSHGSDDDPTDDPTCSICGTKMTPMLENGKVIWTCNCDGKTPPPSGTTTTPPSGTTTTPPSGTTTTPPSGTTTTPPTQTYTSTTPIPTNKVTIDIPLNKTGVANKTNLIAPSTPVKTPISKEELDKKKNDIKCNNNPNAFGFIQDEIRKEEEKAWSDPVKVSSGKVEFDDIDIGFGSININRSYHNNGQIEVPGSFGKTWWMNYDTKVVCGFGYEKLKYLYDYLNRLDSFLSEININKDAFEEYCKKFYIDWQDIRKKYPEMKKLYQEVINAFALAQSALELVPPDLRGGVVLEEPIDDITIGESSSYNNNNYSSEVKLGDVNGDNNVAITDALIILKHCIGLTQTGFNEEAADVNRDGKVDIKDVIIVAKIYVGLETLENDTITVVSSENPISPPDGISWFDFVKERFLIELNEVKNYIPEPVEDKYTLNDIKMLGGYIDPSESGAIQEIISNYNEHYRKKQYFRLILDKMESVIGMFESKFPQVSELCDSGKDIENAIKESETSRSEAEIDKNREESLNGTNRILNSFSDMPEEMLTSGCMTRILFTTGGAPIVYNIPDTIIPDYASMNYIEFKGVKAARNFYHNYDLIELKPSVPMNKSNLYLDGKTGEYIFISSDRTKYYYTPFGQLYMIKDINSNYIEFEYLSGLKNVVETEDFNINAGTVYLSDRNVTVDNGVSFQSHVYLNTGDETLESYTLEINYNPDILSVDTLLGNKGIGTGSDGFVSAVNTDNVKGKILITGFNLMNGISGNALHLLDINWKTINTGVGFIDIDIHSLNNKLFSTIGVPQGIGGRFVVKEGAYTDITEKTNRLIKVKDQFGRELVIERDNVTGLINWIIDPKGRKVSYGYNIDNKLISRTDVDGDTISYTYENGHFKKMIYPDGSCLEYFYIDIDGKKYVDHAINNNGGVESFTYHPGEGESFREDVKGYSEYTDLLGNIERSYYDDRLRTIGEEYSDGSKKEYWYDENDNLVKYKDAEGNIIEYGYDDRNNMLWSSSQNEDEDAIDRISYERWEYNELDKVKKHTDKMNNTTTFEYDAKGNLTAIINTDVINPDGTRIEYTRDILGRVIETKDAKGNKTKYEYDQYGYSNKIINAIGVKKLEAGDIEGAQQNSVEFRYNIIGELELVRDGSGNEIKYEREDKGDTVEKRVIDSYGVIKSIYNNRKDLIKTFDKNGKETNYDYDKMHNVTKITSTSGDTIEYSYNDVYNNYIGRISKKTIGGISNIVYEYNNKGYLKKETQVETGLYTEYEYTAGNNVCKIISQGDRVIENGYTPGGNLKWTSGPEDNYLLRDYYKYNSNGKVRSVTDRRGNETKYEYDNMNRLDKVINAIGTETKMEYDANSNIKIAIENYNLPGYQYKTETEYDELNRATSVIDPMGYKVSTTYNNLGLVEYITGKDGKKIKYEYDKIGRLIKTYKIMKDSTEYLLGSTIFNDPAGRNVTVIDECDNSVNTLYDYMGRVKEYTDELGHKTNYEYNKLGKTSKITNAKNYESSFIYDEAGRLKTAINPNGESIEYDYDVENRTSKVIDAEGRSYLTKFDKYGRIVEKNIIVKDENGVERSVIDGDRYRYDEVGNLIESIDADGKIYQYKYDKLNRLIEEINKSLTSKKYEYYPTGGLTPDKSRVIDFNGYISISTYDMLGRIVMQEAGEIKRFQYNSDGSIMKADNGDNCYLNYEYDEFGTLKKEYEDSQSTTVEYEIDRINKITKRKMYKSEYPNYARVVEYQYDKANRLNKVIDGDGAEIIFNYDEINRLEKEIRPNGINVEYKYDNAGRILEIKNVNRNTNELLSGISYDYDKSGMIINKIDEKGGVTRYKYDETGRIKEAMYPFTSAKVVDALEEIVNTGNYVINNNQSNTDKYTYNLTESNLNEVNKSDIEIMLDSKEEVKRKYLGLQPTDDIKWEISRGIGAIEFGRELNADIETEQALRNKLSNLTNNAITFDNNQKIWMELYEYDKRGNLISKTNGWGNIGYSYDVNDKLKNAGSREFTYDNNGNMTKEKLGNVEAIYKYNSTNRIQDIRNDTKGFIGDIGLEQGGVTYYYDVFGRRMYNYVYNISSDGSSRYNRNLTKVEVYSGSGIESLGQVNAFGYLEIENVRAGKNILSKIIFDSNNNINNKQYYHQDNLGSTIMKSDVSGNITGKYSYDVFGNNYGQIFNQEVEFGYTGKPYANETGLYNYGYRDYSPQLARFTTVDPIKDSNNWYAYCSNDPVNKIDVDGLEETKAIGVWSKSATDKAIFELAKNTVDLLVIQQPYRSFNKTQLKESLIKYGFSYANKILVICGSGEKGDVVIKALGDACSVTSAITKGYNTGQDALKKWNDAYKILYEKSKDVTNQYSKRTIFLAKAQGPLLVVNVAINLWSAGSATNDMYNLMTEQFENCEDYDNWYIDPYGYNPFDPYAFNMKLFQSGLNIAEMYSWSVSNGAALLSPVTGGFTSPVVGGAAVMAISCRVINTGCYWLMYFFPSDIIIVPKKSLPLYVTGFNPLHPGGMIDLRYILDKYPVPDINVTIEFEYKDDFTSPDRPIFWGPDGRVNVNEKNYVDPVVQKIQCRLKAKY